MDASENVPAKYCSKCGELKPLSEYYLKSDLEQHRAQCKVCSLKEQKDYYQEHQEYYRGQSRQYFQDNKYQIYEQRRNRYHTNDAYRITANLRSRLYQAMNSQGATKYDNTMKLVGCSPEWLTAWLNYTESIYCVNKESTHIDHVIPFSAYDLFNPIEQQNAMNWTNQE